jgi:hypothetical protein
MPEDILIYVDNNLGNDTNPGTRSSPLATADEAFRRLPAYWPGRAEIIFAVTHRDYPVRTGAVYFGTPVGPDASPLVIRGGYLDELIVRATAPSSGDYVVMNTDIPPDGLIGAVLTRMTGIGSPIGNAISIRGNGSGVNSSIALQRTIGSIAAGDAFKVQRPAVTLAPTETLNLTSHDARSPNCTLVGIKFEPAAGAGINLLNLRAQCDTCEFSFRTASSFVHTSARIQGGIENENLTPGLGCQRAQAGVYIHSDDTSDVFSAVRDGILSGHLTFKTITVRVSQGGALVPQSLEALGAPIQILTGGAAMAQPSWGTATNKARIRNVPGPVSDGLRVFNGGALNSPLGAIHLDIYGCNGDGIRLDMGSSASFGPPNKACGLVTTGNKNLGFGMNVRNASQAIVGTDMVSVPPAPPPTALTGAGGDVALDDVAVTDGSRRGWAAVSDGPRSNTRLSLVYVSI